MEMNLVNSLTDQQKREYLAVSRVFGTEGWQILSNHYKSLAEQMLQVGANAGSWDEVVAAKAMRLAYDTFANLEDATEASFTQLAQATQAQVNFEDEGNFE